MPNVKQLIRTLAKHAIAKKGARQNPNWCNFDVLEDPHVDLPGASWTDFFETTQEGEQHVARLPVFADRLKELQQHYPMIRQSFWLERDGHIQMTVPLDAGMPTGFFKSLIDEAYALVCNKLDADARLQIELAGLPYDERKLLDRLIGMHQLKEHRQAIRKLARQAILLPTKKVSEAKIALGASKAGGRPDLPATTAWPVYRDGKPLVFLAQINLKEIAKLGSPIKGLPADGLLSVFSVWGWMEEGDLDPHTPHDGTELNQEEHGWTVVLHTPARVPLERRQTPRGVNSFKAAAVEPTPILSLPHDRHEPALRALGWTENAYARFDELVLAFRSLQMRHWTKSGDRLASCLQLGGYAYFQQQFPEDVLDKGLAMFLQIASDGKNSNMQWSDGGELTFYADAKALAKGRFERVWGTCQGG